VATGGAGIVEVGRTDTGDLEHQPEGFGDPQAVPSGGAEGAVATPSALPASPATSGAAGKAGATAADDRVSALRNEARRLAAIADERSLSLEELVGQLEDKHEKLASSPAIWPTQGWLTSRFGTRISPFTGKRQFHAGIDIAGATGTEVVATAHGKVTFAGTKGPLGKAVIIDHGHGVRTHYGHNKELFVKRGDVVERGQRISALGNTGRSTGPHVHYSVEVKGKAVNPLDYIFD
jgi:murein DD-endopeptidase MepM/ murein hydrolase activator NlpD